MASPLERLARNQVLFRDVNERLSALTDGAMGTIDYLCECTSQECTATVPLERMEYERIRSHSNRFLISPGHEVAAVDRVVWESDRYSLVDKVVGAEYAMEGRPTMSGN